MGKRKRPAYNSAEREGLAIDKMRDYALDRPAGRFQAKHPKRSIESLARPSVEQMQESLGNILDDFKSQIKQEKNRLK